MNDETRRVKELLLAALSQILGHLKIPAQVSVCDTAPIYMTVAEYAERVRLTQKSVRALVLDGLPHARPRPRMLRIKVRDADEWLARRGSQTVPPSAKVDARRGVLR